MRMIRVCIALSLLSALTACNRPDAIIKDTTGNLVLGGDTMFIRAFHPFTNRESAQGASKAKPMMTPKEQSDGWSNSQRGLQYHF